VPRDPVSKGAERRRAWPTARRRLWAGIVGLQLAGATIASLAQEPRESRLEDMACLAALADLGVQAEPATIDPVEEDCGVEQPVRLRSLASDGAVLEFAETPTLACGFAVVLSRWLAESAIPAARSHLGQLPAKVLVGPGHACRPRNQQPGAELSVHAFGIALDIRGFELPDGEQIMIEPGDHAAAERTFLEALRTSACDYFTTVLGPGSDRYHSDHLHVDLERHGRSDQDRICQ
jgi:hypothetical protein